MKLKYLVVGVAVLGFLVVTGSAQAINRPENVPVSDSFAVCEEKQILTEYPGSGGLRAGGDNCSDPAMNIGTLPGGTTMVPVDTYGWMGDLFEDTSGQCPAPCGWYPVLDFYGVDDGIMAFQVSVGGMWTISTCAASYTDNALQLRAAADGADPCPGSICLEQDDGGCGGTCYSPYQSIVGPVQLDVGTQYYLIIEYTWYGTVSFIGPCDDDSQCDDGEFCNGIEYCDLGTGYCVSGAALQWPNGTTRDCEMYQDCDEGTDTCVDPDPCLAYLDDVRSGYYCSGCYGAWEADDIFPAEVAGRNLEYYQMLVICRGTNPPFNMDTQLFEFYQGCDGDGFPCDTDADCAGHGGSEVCVYYYQPGDPIPNTQCSFTGLACGSGTYPTATCYPTDTVTLPDLFWMGYMAYSPASTGFIIDGPPRIGAYLYDWPDALGNPVPIVGSDDVWGEYDGAAWGMWWFGGWPANNYGSFEGAVCTTPMGRCCLPDRAGCVDNTEAECTGLGGSWTGSTLSNPVACEDPDGDGVYTFCDDDNCPDDPNPGQEDCNADDEGDACEASWDEQDDDGDGVCNGVDGCPNDPNKTDPGVCGCGIPDTDNDGDGAANCIDPCPNDPLKFIPGTGLWQAPGQCGCGNPDTDTDGDGIADCIDGCPGVDNAQFPGCEDAIPTVSEWGILILALLLLAAGKVYFRRATC